MHHTEVVLLDGVGGTNFRARRVFAMHAHDRRGLDARGTMNVIQMNHRHAAMRAALRASLHARLAADAARRVEEKFEISLH